MVARITDMNVVNALTAASLARVSNVWGSEQKNETTAMIALKPMVQRPWLVMVLRYLAPTKQWKPWIIVLFKRNMTAVAHQAQRWPQNKI